MSRYIPKKASSYYCVIARSLRNPYLSYDDPNDVVWGIGLSCKEAKADALKYIEDYNRMAKMSPDMEVLHIRHKDLECYPCTEELYKTVEEDGGDVEFIIRRGVAHLV